MNTTPTTNLIEDLLRVDDGFTEELNSGATIWLEAFPNESIRNDGVNQLRVVIEHDDGGTVTLHEFSGHGLLHNTTKWNRVTDENRRRIFDFILDTLG